MSNRNMNHPWTFGRKTKIISGSFATNNTAAVDQTTIKGTTAIASVTRNSAGNFTVLLRDGYADLNAEFCSVRCSTNSDLYAQFGAFTNVGSTTGAPVSFVIRLLTGSTETDMVANADNRVSFMLIFRDST